MLHGLDYDLPVASAQVKTCLLLAALAASEPTILREPGFSRDHSERMLSSMGVAITSERLNYEGGAVYQTRLAPPSPLRLRPLSLSLPGDFSAAAFLIVATLVTPGSQVMLKDVGLNPGRTGLLDVLLAMGGSIQIGGQAVRGGEPVGNLTIRHSRLHGTRVRGDLVPRMIDEFPVLAVAAACAEGPTVVSGAAELRSKESDRITALCEELCRLGVDIAEHPDGFTLTGGTAPRGGTASASGDHRLAMSLAVAGLAARQPVTVQGAEMINESFPGFTSALKSLGARLETGG